MFLFLVNKATNYVFFSEDKKKDIDTAEDTEEKREN